MDFESISVVALLIFLLYEPRFSIIIIILISFIIFILTVIYPALMRDGMENKEKSQELLNQSQSITFYLLCILLVVLFLKRYI